MKARKKMNLMLRPGWIVNFDSFMKEINRY